MGKSFRSRPRSSPADNSAEMRRHGIKKSVSADDRSCRASSGVLILLVAFALTFFTIFVFTVRTGPTNRASRGAVSQEMRMRKETGLDNGDEIGEADHGSRQLEDDGVGIYGYEVVREFYHDPTAFTQGLVYAGNGTFYESTGLYGQSTVREVDILTGKVRRKQRMKNHYFGEGLTIWKNRLLQLAWRESKVFIYDRETLTLLGESSHSMKDGWGLTTSEEHIVGSDGTCKLYFMNPNTFEGVRVITVMDELKEVGWLNELEFVNNEIWANIWQGECIARISPQDGRVTGWILLHGLRSELLAAGNQGIDVLNGIAWDSEENKLYVTGKNWPKLYEIKLLDRTNNANAHLQAVRKLCNVGRQGFQ